jgi:hypothetical protein
VDGLRCISLISSPPRVRRVTIHPDLTSRQHRSMEDTVPGCRTRMLHDLFIEPCGQSPTKRAPPLKGDIDLLTTSVADWASRSGQALSPTPVLRPFLTGSFSEPGGPNLELANGDSMVERSNRERGGTRAARSLDGQQSILLSVPLLVPRVLWSGYANGEGGW